MHRSAVAVLSLALWSCRPAPPVTPARIEKLEQRLDRIEAALGQRGGGAVPATPEGRLARVEQRLDRVIEFLRQAVRAELDTSVTYAVPIDPLDPVRGPATAKVTIVEAYEFLCPYCNQMAPTIDQLAARYPKDVRIVSKYFVIHGEAAEPSGRAACAAARQGKYPAFSKALWAKIWPAPGEPAKKELATAVAVEQTAKQAGVELKRFRADVAGACADWPARSSAVLQRFGAGGTPSYYVNGRYVQGMSLDELSALVEQEIKKVDASGARPGKYYDEVVLARGAKEARMISPFD